MPDYALSAAQVAQYEEEGFLLLPDFFPRQDMDQMLAIARADQALQDNANDRLDGAGKVSRLSLRYDLPASVYSAYARHRAIVEPMEQLIGDEVFHYHHKMMLKEPRVGGAWEWHQDYGYWYANFLRADMASCMIAVDRASRENGCLQVLKGSHKLGRIEHGKSGDQTGADMERVRLAEGSWSACAARWSRARCCFFTAICCIARIPMKATIRAGRLSAVTVRRPIRRFRSRLRAATTKH